MTQFRDAYTHASSSLSLKVGMPLGVSCAGDDCDYSYFKEIHFTKGISLAIKFRLEIRFDAISLSEDFKMTYACHDCAKSARPV